MKPAAGCLALCLSLSACSAASYQANTRQPVEAPVPAGAVVLFVTNGNAEDVRLYLLRGSTQIPIGSVGSFSARRFVIPAVQVGSGGELRLIAQALASRAVAAPEALDIEPGAEVEFKIETNLTYSRLVPRVLRER
jgi:hypothetical protein